MISLRDPSTSDGEPDRDLDAFLVHLSRSLGHTNRHAGLGAYLRGLVSAMAAPRDTLWPEPPGAAQAQARHHFVARSAWDDQTLRECVLARVLPFLNPEGRRFWVIDEVATPKKGDHSVGVGYQRANRQGKFAHCQVAVRLSLASPQGSIPLAQQLYLPRAWVEQPAKREPVGIPPQLGYRAKSTIALALLRQAGETQPPPAMVLADSRWVDLTGLREGIGALGLRHAVEVGPTCLVRWTIGAPWLPPPVLGWFQPGSAPVTVQALADALPETYWQSLPPPEGPDPPASTRYARLWVQPSDGDQAHPAFTQDATLLIEKTDGTSGSFRYCLSNMDPALSLQQMVGACTMDLQTTRNHAAMDTALGMYPYEGRSWRGFHHHATLCMAAHAFWVCQRLKLAQTAGH